MKRTILLSLVGLALMAGTVNANVIAFWHFNNVTNVTGDLDKINGFGTSSAKTEYAKDTGTATLAEISVWGTGDGTEGTLVGSNGSYSTYSQAFGGMYPGTTLNWPSEAGAPVAGDALYIGNGNENKYFLIELDDAITDCLLTYDTKYDGTAPTNSQTISYSNDGGSSWHYVVSVTPGSSWSTKTVSLDDYFAFSSGDEMNLIRITVTGLTACYHEFDNIVLTPEPATVSLLVLASLFLGRRRK